MDLLDAVRAFVRVAESGNFSAAARDLAVSQPHVTRAVQQLETRLGARLFLRSTRAVRLTDEGSEYLERCHAMLVAVDEADHSVGHRAGRLTGRLRVFAPVSLGRAWVVPRLPEFMARHTQLEVQLILDDSVRDMTEERIDVALRVGPLAEQGLRSRHLGDVQRVVVATPDYWQQRGRPDRPEALADHETLIFDGPILVDRIVLDRGAERQSVGLRGRFRTNSSEAIQEATLRGMGVCIAPWWLVAADLAAGRLMRVLDDWVISPPLPIHAAYAPSRAPVEKVRRFVDWLIFTLHADNLYGPGGEGAVEAQ
jgi:DNA-binding transcriptional LysR family regulator